MADKETPVYTPAINDEQFYEHMKEAISSLARCWDALLEAEGILQDALDEGTVKRESKGYKGEIETDQITDITSAIGEPAEAYGLPLQYIDEAVGLTRVEKGGA